MREDISSFYYQHYWCYIIIIRLHVCHPWCIWFCYCID